MKTQANGERVLQRGEMFWRAADFLLSFRMATPEALIDAIHPGADRPTSPPNAYMKKLKARGLITDVRAPGTRKTWIATKMAQGASKHLGWLPTTTPGKMTGVKRQHILATADIAAQIITGRNNGLLGLDDKEWQQVKSEIKQGHARLIAEKEFDTTWKKLTDEQRAQVRASTSNDPQGTALVAFDAGAFFDPDYEYLWTLNHQGLAFFSDEEEDRLRYQNAKHVLGPNLEVPSDESDSIFPLWDHNPDAVLLIAGDKPQAYALETELNPKNLHSYIRTLASYQSPYGLALYRHVTWLCADGYTYNLLYRALKIVGNKNDQIKIIRIKPAKRGDDFYIGTRVVRNFDAEKKKPRMTNGLPAAFNNQNEEPIEDDDENDDEAFPIEEEPIEDTDEDEMPIIETIARPDVSPFDEIHTDTSDFLE